MAQRLKRIVIVGGGTAGWMAAASLAERFAGNGYTQIKLVESSQIGTVGVGEATVPAIRNYLNSLKIDESDFVRRTGATLKLAIKFDGWRAPGHAFFHPFSEYGIPIKSVPFFDIWTKLTADGKADELDRYSLGTQLARAKKFALHKSGAATTPGTRFNHAFHFDSGLVAKYLRSWSELAGVERIEGTIIDVRRDGLSGNVASVLLADGQTIEGDFFIDCSGFRSVLIEQVLDTGFEDWSAWLPCDSALTAASPAQDEPSSYTVASAQSAGWRWQIPLQHRTGNGYVYSSQFLRDEDAHRDFYRDELEGAGDNARVIRFRAGVRKKLWNKNVLALGLASGFLEPLESTSIYLVQAALQSFIRTFPSTIDNPVLRDEFNRRQYGHWCHIRDFIILHYHINQRRHEKFWEYCREYKLPESLSETLSVYENTGRIRKEQTEFFQASSWQSILAGAGRIPAYYHPSVDDLDTSALARELSAYSSAISQAADSALAHGQFLRRNGLLAD